MKTIKLDTMGLVAAIVQHFETDKVLMLGYMNEESIKKTLETKNVWFFSRSRSELWEKGSTSGNYLKLQSFNLDCDGDAILLKVLPEGPTCHTGSDSCFEDVQDGTFEYEQEPAGAKILDAIFQIIEERKLKPTPDSYTSKLLGGDMNRIAQKVIEEAGEAAIAGATSKKVELAEELGDVLYHALVLLAANDMNLDDVWDVLETRRSR